MDLGAPAGRLGGECFPVAYVEVEKVFGAVGILQAAGVGDEGLPNPQPVLGLPAGGGLSGRASSTSGGSVRPPGTLRAAGLHEGLSVADQRSKQRHGSVDRIPRSRDPSQGPPRVFIPRGGALLVEGLLSPNLDGLGASRTLNVRGGTGRGMLGKRFGGPDAADQDNRQAHTLISRKTLSPSRRARYGAPALWLRTASLKILEDLGVDILYLRHPDMLYHKDEEMILDGFVASTPDFADRATLESVADPDFASDSTESANDDLGVIYPYAQHGTVSLHTDHHFFVRTDEPLSEGMHGAHVFDLDGALSGMVERILPATHSNPTLAGSVACMPTHVMNTFVNFVEHGLLKDKIPELFK